VAPAEQILPPLKGIQGIILFFIHKLPSAAAVVAAQPIRPPGLTVVPAAARRAVAALLELVWVLLGRVTTVGKAQAQPIAPEIRVVAAVQIKSAPTLLPVPPALVVTG
jgi:hypothetical protein